MTSLKTSIKTITYLSDIGCLEIQGASLDTHLAFHLTETGTAYQSRLKIVTMVPKALTAGSHVFFPNHSMPNHL